jgi:hypothetical protein
MKMKVVWSHFAQNGSNKNAQKDQAATNDRLHFFLL